MSAEGNFTRMDMYSPAHQHGGGTTTTTTAAAFTSRTQEKLELQQLNDRFAAYVQRVRQLAEKRNHVDSSTILKSTQAMEAEMFTLRDMYEQELEKLRKELENCNHERTTHQVQCNKHMQCASELQDRLQVEMDRSGKLHDEINNYQCRIGSLEAEIQNMRIAASRPSTELEQLQRNMANMTREIEIWKHRYEHEQVARQEAESKIQQLMQKAQFNEKVSRERMGELSSRIEMSTATILSLEAKVRDLSKADISVAELLKQVRDTAEGELKKYQIESEEQYNMNLTALKTQLDNEAKVKEDLEKERNQLRGSMGEQQARIRALEGQVSQLEHQRRAVEEVLVGERGRAADSMRQLEQKMREVQEMLVVKMREVSSAREQNIPLKAEIETLKALLEEEEKRLRLSVAIPSVMGSHGETTATGMSNYNNTASFAPTTTNSASNATASFNTVSNTTSATTTTTTYNSTSNTSTIPPMQTSYASMHSPPPNFTSSSAHNMVSFVEDPNRHYVSSPLLSVTYTPEFLQSTGTSIDPMFTYPQYEDELDPQLFGYSGTLPLAKYMCENSPALNRVSVEPSPPNTPRPTGNSRAKSAPAERQRNLNLVRSDIGQGHDYFDKMFYDLQQDTLYSQGRPRSSQNERLSSSVYNDYAVSTSRAEDSPACPAPWWETYCSSTGDLKIAEVQQDGKYIRLVNEGAQEMEFGGFMIQQNVGGHPVAVFRFPARSRFPPNSPITIYAGCNDLQQHQLPHDFVWKEQQKWGSGPECTTILCRPNGQAVAWTTAAHRFTRDAFQDSHKDMDRSENRAVTIMEEKSVEDLADDDSLADGNTNSNGNKTEQPISLRREKQQPPTLQTSGAVYVNGNAQSRDPTCPDVVPAAQKGSSSSQRKYVSGVSSYQHSGMRGTGKTKKNFLNYLLNDTALH